MDKPNENTEVVVETAEGTYESAVYADVPKVEEVKDEDTTEDTPEGSGEQAADDTSESRDEVASAEDAEEGGASEDNQKSELEKRLAELEAQVQLREIYDSVGGQEAYTALAEKAKEKLPANLIEAYDDLVVNGSLEQAKFAVAALQSMVGPVHVEASSTYGGAQVASNDGFKDTLSFMEALKDPRYNVDPLYTQEVVNKLANSPNVSL